MIVTALIGALKLQQFPLQVACDFTDLPSVLLCEFLSCIHYHYEGQKNEDQVELEDNVLKYYPRWTIPPQ